MGVATQVALPQYHPFIAADVPWLMRQAVADHGNKPFLHWEPFEEGRRSWTYAQAHADIRRIAAGLSARGVRPRDAVLLHLENSPESILAWLACAEVGAVGVTTNARSAGPELAYFAEKTGAVGIVTQPAFEALAREHLEGRCWIEIVAPGDGARVLGADGALPERPADPALPFSVQFTSGTTARPKGVVWTHANGLWGAMCNARHLGVRPDDVALVHYPLFHTVAQAWQTLASIWAGASVVLQPKFSASRFWDVVVRHGCTWTTSGGFQTAALAGHPVPPNHRLRLFVGFSEKGSPRHFGVKASGAHGMTELISHAIFADPAGPMAQMTMGRPAPEYEIAIVRPDGSRSEMGEPGELLVKGVRGLTMFAEYLDDPEATAAAFTPDGFFRTGDQVTLRPDGELVFNDRLKDMLKVGGENVAASEVEAAVRRVAGVREVAVVAQPHPMLSEVPFAFVIAADGAPGDLAEQIMSACARDLADFKRPRGVRLVEDFPRSLINKVAKAELRRMLRDEAQA